MQYQKSDAQILAEEERAIDLLVRETHMPLKTVQDLFLSEVTRLTAHAHIQSFVSLLASNGVRTTLDARNAAALIAKPPQIPPDPG